MNQQAFQEKYGRWAIITGASEGIGRAFARTLAAHKFSLVLVARREPQLEALAQELKAKHHIDTLIIVADMANSEAVRRVMDGTKDLDIGLLIAAAGFGTSGPFLDNAIKDELEMIDVNCRAVIELLHNYGQRFKRRGRGGLILFSSLVGFQGVSRSANYAATKAFIQTFVEGWRLEMKPFGVDVLAVSPGPIKSGFSARANMTMGISQGPEVIPEASLKALGRQTTVRPGFLSKALELLLKTAPRWGRVRIMSLVMKGMTPRPIP